MLTQVDIQKLPSYQLGMEQGLEEGKLQVARNLLDELPDEKIAETTGLSLQVIRRLREEESRKN